MDAKTKDWQPPDKVSREDTLARSDAVLAMPDLPLRQTEDIFRIQALGLDWDMGVTVYEPADPAKIARGADGKKIGIFLLHGGSGDYKSMEPIAKLFAEKFGCKAVAMTFPGRLYLDDASARLAGRHHPRRRHRAHADLAHRRTHHARPVRGGARHLDAHALRHPHGRRAPSPAPSSTTAWRRGRSPSRPA